MSDVFASIAQLGERKTEDLEAPCSIHGRSSNLNGTSAGVVNGADLKSAGLWPRRFESFLVRFLGDFYNMHPIPKNPFIPGWSTPMPLSLSPG